MAKYVKTYHEGLTAEAINSITVYRMTVTYSWTHTTFAGEVHQDYFESNGALLYSYLMDAMADMSAIESIKIEKV